MNTKTLRELWNETPPGEKIADPQYQLLCNVLETYTAKTVHDFGVKFFNSDCMTATRMALEWAAAEYKRNPNYLEEIKLEQRRRMWVID